jgi:hypothetical protein
MKASASRFAVPHRRAARRGDAFRVGHMLALLAALSLLAVSTAAWADRIAGRSTVEFDTTPARPWNDGSALQMRYVRWAPAGHAALGVSMGLGAAQAPPAGPYALQPDAHGTVGLAPEVGLRWRTSWQENRRIDVGAYGSYDASTTVAQNERRAYNARVELQFRDGRSKLGFDIPHGALGLQVGHDSQVMLRSRHGGPMVYYRSKW